MRKIKKITTSIFILLLLNCASCDNDGCPDKSCSDFATQSQAQVAFDADKDCLGELDHDSDGIACEHLPAGGGRTGGCPTTSNCGCSGKNKDQCASSCCKWVVGTGCKCK